MFALNKNNVSKSESIILVCVGMMFLSVIILFGQMYNKTMDIDFERHFACEESIHGLLEKPLFTETFVSLYDKNFFRHSGFVLLDDFFGVYEIGSNRNKTEVTIHRALASRIKTKGLFRNVYQQYMLPIRLEREFSKEQLLLFFVCELEKISGKPYLDIINAHSNSQNFSVYDWAIVHSVHRAANKNEKSLIEIEHMFFEVLNDMYAGGLIADHEIEKINEKHRTRFLSDISQFVPMPKIEPTKPVVRPDRPEPGASVQSWPRGMGGAVRWAQLVRYYADKHDIDFAYFMAIIQAESNGDPNAVSHANAYGLGQVLLSTGRYVSGNPNLTVQQLFNPHINLDISARYIRLNIDRVNNRFPGLNDQQIRTLVAASYNAGWGRVERLGRVPNIEETRNYVKRVDRFYRLYSENESLIINNIAMK